MLCRLTHKNKHPPLASAISYYSHFGENIMEKITYNKINFLHNSKYNMLPYFFLSTNRFICHYSYNYCLNSLSNFAAESLLIPLAHSTKFGSTYT